MGLLKLLAFPLTGPLWVAQTLQNEAERQLYDENAIRAQMEEVERQFRDEEIDGDTFEQLQDELFNRLLEARAYHETRSS
jgi:cytochrome c-type biogenesis protein CcmI